MKRAPIFLAFLFHAACNHFASARSEGDVPDPHLELFRTITARMFDTRQLGKDSCVHVSMQLTSEPRTGQSISQRADLYSGRSSLLFKSEEVEEYMDTRTKIRVWPGDKVVSISKPDRNAMERTTELMNVLNDAIATQAKVKSSRKVISPNGDKTLFMELLLAVPSLGGTITQYVELDLIKEKIRSITLEFPQGHALKRFSIQYLVTECVRLPRPGSVISGIMGRTHPVTKYEDYVVRDLRTKK